jgi:hypothetical protein
MSGRVRALVVGLILSVLPLGLTVWAWMNDAFGPSFTQRTTMGAPVLAPAPGGERIVVFTTHWVTWMISRSSLNRSFSTNYVMEAWGLDAQTLEPAWRAELGRVRSGSRSSNSKTFGAANGHVWHYDNGLWGVAVADGAVAVSPEKLAAANRELAAFMPDSPDMIAFDGGGPLVRTLNGRSWRIDPATAKLIPGTAAPEGSGSADKAAGNTETYFRTVANGRWYGFLRDRDVDFVRKNGAGSSYFMEGGSGMDWGNLPETRALYAAEVTGAPNEADYAWRAKTGPVERWSDLPPLLYAEFLRPPGRFPSHDPTVMIVPNPDSFIVVAADIGGDNGAQVFARIGLDGKMLWLTPTNLMRHWFLMSDNYLRPDGAIAFLHNVVPPEEQRKEIVDRIRDWPKAVVRIDLATGASITKRLDELPFVEE